MALQQGEHSGSDRLRMSKQQDDGLGTLVQEIALQSESASYHGYARMPAMVGDLAGELCDCDGRR